MQNLVYWGYSKCVHEHAHTHTHTYTRWHNSVCWPKTTGAWKHKTTHCCCCWLLCCPRPGRRGGGMPPMAGPPMPIGMPPMGGAAMGGIPRPGRAPTMPMLSPISRAWIWACSSAARLAFTIDSFMACWDCAIAPSPPAIWDSRDQRV